MHPLLLICSGTSATSAKERDRKLEQPMPRETTAITLKRHVKKHAMSAPYPCFHNQVCHTDRRLHTHISMREGDLYSTSIRSHVLGQQSCVVCVQVFGVAFGGGVHGSMTGVAVVSHPLLFIARNAFLLALTAPSLYFLLHYLWTFKVCSITFCRVARTNRF